MLHSLKIVTIFIVLAASSPLLHAFPSNTLHVSSFSQSNTNGRLYTVNASTGAAALVGSLPRSRVTDLAFHGSKLYGITFAQFFRAHPDTGAIIGSARSLGFPDINALAAPRRNTDPLNSSRFFAAGIDGKFITILVLRNSAGNDIGIQVSRLGIYGRDSAGRRLGSSGDLAFFNGVLYAIVKRSGSTNDFLVRVNPTNGRATLVAPGTSTGIGFRDVWGLSVRNGVLFGATRAGRLLRLNASIGVGALSARKTMAWPKAG